MYTCRCPICENEATVKHIFSRRALKCTSCGRVNHAKRDSIIGHKRNGIEVTLQLDNKHGKAYIEDCESLLLSSKHALEYEFNQKVDGSEYLISRTSPPSEITETKKIKLPFFAAECSGCALLSTLVGPPKEIRHFTCVCGHKNSLYESNHLRGKIRCSCGNDSKLGFNGNPNLPITKTFAIEGICSNNDCTSQVKSSGQFFAGSTEAAIIDVGSVVDLELSDIHLGDKTDRLIIHGFRKWSDLYTSRQKRLLFGFARVVKGIEDIEFKISMAGVFLSCLEHSTQLNTFYKPYSQSAGCFGRHDYHPKPEPCEVNPLLQKGRGTILNGINAKLKAIEYLLNPWDYHFTGTTKEKKVRIHRNRSINPVLGALNEIIDGASNSCILRSDATKPIVKQKIASLVLTDPPYSDSVQYAELADFFLCWFAELGLTKIDEDTFKVKSPTSNEVVVNKTRKSDQDRYSQLLTRVFKSCAGALRPDGKLVFTFHHTSMDSWVSVLLAIVNSGFTLVDAYPLKGESKITGNLMFHSNKSTPEMDVVLICRGNGQESSKKRTKLDEQMKIFDNIHDKRSYTLSEVLPEITQQLHTINEEKRKEECDLILKKFFE
jgi:putative DNA methylase